MNKQSRTLLFCMSLLLVPSYAAADEPKPAASQPTPASAGQQKLLGLFEQAKDKAQKSAAAATNTEELLKLTPRSSKAAPAAPPNAPAKAAPAKQESGDLLRQLASEVDTLQSKMTVTNSTILSTQKPKAAKRIGSKVTYAYKEGDVYEVHAGVDRITDIELQAGEQLTNPPVSGDTVRWKVGIVKSSSGSKEVSHVILKPLDSELETNVLITTNRHVYHLRAVSGDWYMPAVSWNYPQEEEPGFSAMLRQQKGEQQLHVLPDKLNFEYEIDGDDYDWKPVRAFDDGKKTYIQMPKSLEASDAPALFVIEDDESMLVNYRVKGRYYVMDRLFEKAEMRVGSKRKIEIQKGRRHRSFFERLFGG